MFQADLFTDAPGVTDPAQRCDFGGYDKFIVAFSGGKDSLACLLSLLEAGVERCRIELWHHNVDGRESAHLVDWPCTPAYCRAVAKAFGVEYYESWREGGFEREMLRNNTPTAPTHFEAPDGIRTAGGKSGKLGTRRRFPQVSADLSVRYCSAYLKVDVCSIAVANQERFRNQRILVVSGERAEESAARSKYRAFEPDRSDARDGVLKRHVDRYRPVHRWSEEEVWAIIERWNVQPHVAYRLGWGRVSCALCIFGSRNQWASARAVMPEQFKRVAGFEREFGTTIDRSMDVVAKADLGKAYPGCSDPELVAEALDSNWDRDVFVNGWSLPAGAFGDGCGPT